jgi:hypothetical protein
VREQRRAIVAREQRCAIIAHFGRRPIKLAKDVELSELLRAPIQELGEPLHGLQCTREQDACSFITVNVKTLQIHMEKEHGKAWKGNTTALYQSVKVQTFFLVGARLKIAGRQRLNNLDLMKSYLSRRAGHLYIQTHQCLIPAQDWPWIQ